jgi:hypothetical protein
MTLGRLLRSLFSGAATLGFALVLSATANAQVAVSIDGTAVNIAPPPVIQGGRVLVPLRGVFERLGASVVYSNGEINATGNGNEISLHIGSTQATINGQPQTIDVAPFIIGASTYVPLRFVSEALGAGVQWDEADRLVAITTTGGQTGPPPDTGAPSYAEGSDWVSEAPPPIPAYDPPPVPQPQDIWIPGYWAWGPGGYYWVPGTWVQAPQPGYLWTPGYWGWQNGYYGWNPGYWATAVGYYGGVYYGGGYYGNGYAGGRWNGNVFRYNTAVARVAPTIVNVYVDRTVVVSRPATRSSFTGGPGGLRAQPTAAQIAVGKTRHILMTATQTQHAQAAAQDRRLLATVNAGKPPIVSATKPFTPASKPAGFVPITQQDKLAAQKFIAHPTSAPGLAAPQRSTTLAPQPIRPPLHLATRAPQTLRTAPPATRRLVTAPPQRSTTLPPQPIRPPLHLVTRAPQTLRTAPPATNPLATAPPAMQRLVTAPPAVERLVTRAPAPVRVATQAPVPEHVTTAAPTLVRPVNIETPRPRATPVPPPAAAPAAAPAATPTPKLTPKPRPPRPTPVPRPTPTPEQ